MYKCDENGDGLQKVKTTNTARTEKHVKPNPDPRNRNKLEANIT